MATKNKFGAAFDAIREAGDQDDTPEALGESLQPAGDAPAVAPTRRNTAGGRARLAAPERRGPGRPPGKRSDPNYRQVTGLIPRELHFEITKALLEERRGRDMGELMTELFQRWLKGKGG